MGINPTPTNHRSFTYDGKSTREFGVYITGKDVFNAPERAVEMISIPGRDGEYALDQGHFNNIEVTYRAGIVADSTTDFAEAISNFRNWLASREGYCRLTDEYNTEEYRMAVFKNAIALEHEGLLTGEFDVTFDCKPQRFLAIGEELTEIGAWGNTETAEGEVVTIDASSDTAVKALTADIEPIQDLHGYDAPWVGGAGKNKLLYPYSETTVERYDIKFTDNGNGQININGTATARAVFFLHTHASAQILQSGTYTFSKGIELSSVELHVDAYNGNTWKRSLLSTTNESATFTVDYSDYDDVEIFIAVQNTAVISNKLVKPMIRLSSVSDTTWQPYENICPISGSASVTVYDTDEQYYSPSNTVIGKNWINGNDEKRAINKFNIVGGGTYKVYTKGGNFSNILFIQMNGTSQITNRSIASPTNENVTLDANCNNIILQFEKATAITADDFNDFVCSVSKQLTTTTTQLGQTVYGGTLDVVSGVLTVTHGYKTYNGSEAWPYSAVWSRNDTSVFYTSSDSSIYYPSWSYNPITKCNMMPTGSRDQVYGSETPIFGVSGTYGAGNPTVRVPNSIATTENAFQAYLAQNPLQIAYELATPQTYQLTPQQVELLLGENNIFADSGNVTVEYGHNPTLLTNPTWFPSKPLLAVDGYGEIKLNDYNMRIQDVPVGDITLVGASSFFLDNGSNGGTTSFTIDESELNTGDKITVSIEKLCFDVIINAASGYNIENRYTSDMYDENEHFVSPTYSYYSGTKTVLKYTGNMSASISFDVGTSSTVSGELPSYIKVRKTSPSPLEIEDIWFRLYPTVSYNANIKKITISWYGQSSWQGVVGSLPTFLSSVEFRNTTNQSKLDSIKAYSTKSTLTDTIYVDCEIGECYTIRNGSVITLNDTVTLGSDLPTLPSGDTEVTYDNTITKVEVKPNWWKV